MSHFYDCILCVLTFLIGVRGEEASSLEAHPGHLKPFGQSGTIVRIDGYEGFPSAKHFYLSYVKPRRPLKMRGAAKLFPSHRLWDDNYFLGLDIGRKRNAFVHVETMKKEDREQPTDHMHFHDFVRIYNKTEHYMVQSVPDFLKQDVPLPGPLQCKRISDKIADILMWFSSGGTKSVVHTDGVDNINCLIRGEKSFVIVDDKYKKFVPLDRSNGTFSSLDVDSVDLKKYPELRHVKEFYHVQMKAGDCLYIPYKWIHQVRSFNRNIAVNFWWDSNWITHSDDMWEKECRPTFDSAVTADKLTPIGIEAMEFVTTLKKVISSTNTPLDPDSFILALNSEADVLEREIGIGFKMQLNQIFLIADKDKDMLLTNDDINLWSVEDMHRMDIYYRRYERILQAVEEHFQQQANERDANQELAPEFRGLREEL